MSERDEHGGNGGIDADVLGFPDYVCATGGTENVLVGGLVCVWGRIGGVYRRDVVDVWWVDGWFAVNLEKENAYAKCVICG